MIPTGELFHRDTAAEKPIQKAKKPPKHDPTDFDKFCWYEAPHMEYVAHCYIPKLTQQEIWAKSRDWIYDRFDRLVERYGSAMLTGISTKDMEAMIKIAPAMNEAWETALNDDEIWRERAKRHGRLRTWWLRWQLRHLSHDSWTQEG